MSHYFSITSSMRYISCIHCYVQIFSVNVLHQVFATGRMKLQRGRQKRSQSETKGEMLIPFYLTEKLQMKKCLRKLQTRSLVELTQTVPYLQQKQGIDRQTGTHAHTHRKEALIHHKQLFSYLQSQQQRSSSLLNVCAPSPLVQKMSFHLLVVFLINFLNFFIILHL